METLEQLDALTEQYLQEKDYQKAQEAAWQQLDIDKLRESAVRQLMTALAKSGQRSAAMAQYEIYSKRLEESLGAKPSTELAELYQGIQNEELQQTVLRSQIQVPSDSTEINPIFCYTDIESSTRLWDEHREAMFGALLQHNDLCETEIERFEGRILHPTGDGFLIVFEQNDPLQFAISLQQKFAEADWGEIGELRIRIGLHGTTADQEGHEFFREGGWYRGSILNHAARISDTGHGGQIVASPFVKEQCPLPAGASWVDLGEHGLKSLDDKQQILGLVHPDLPLKDFPPLRTPDNKRAAQTDKIRGYQLGQKIGQGAFGDVYRAVQPGVGRPVAVKIIRALYANQPDFIRRFEAEAQVIAQLEHPNIVPLYDYWRESDGAFLVMRFMRGGSLEGLLREGPLDLRTAISYLDQAAAALNFAHQQGYVHRDIKPANILLDEQGNAYLSDFGIVKNIHSESEQTQTGAVVGSPAYLSPEQALSQPVTPFSDQYSLAVTLYELLTGERAFDDASPASLIIKHLNEPLPLVRTNRPELSEAVDVCIQKATAKEPNDRYPDILAMMQALHAATGTGSSAYAMPTALLDPERELVNPYQGLRSFQEADAVKFFGRTALVEQLLTRFQSSPNSARSADQTPPTDRFLAVVGPSGSGKSSVVKAGLLPALRNGAVPGSSKWFFVEMIPGTHPLEELEASLLRIAVNPPASLLEQLEKDERGLVRALKRVMPQDGGELLLVIDQFEELYTLLEDDERRSHFINSLLAALSDHSGKLRVVVTLRADFYDRPLTTPGLAELMRSCMEIVPPLKRSELEEVIVQPALQVGAMFESGLVPAIIDEVSEQPGALPLLQYALTELFERRRERLLTLAAFTEIGGVLGALGRRAEELFADLDAAGQEAARQVFMRLVTLGEGTEDTRRRVLRSELTALQTSEVSKTSEVLDAYGRYRLLTFDRDPLTREPTVEVAHEALLREWQRLHIWLDESRDDVRLQRSLALFAAEWADNNQAEGFLLRDSRLDLFTGWAAGTTLALTPHEQTFLQASVAAREQRELAERARQARELEAAQKLAETEKARAEAEQQRAESQLAAAQNLRRRAAYLGIALVVAALLAVAAVFASIQANNNAQTAVANANIAATQEAAASAAQAQAEIESQRADAERDSALNAQATAVAEGVRADEQRDVALAAEVQANEARVVAEEQTQIAFSRELAGKAVNNLGEEPEQSVLLAQQALKTAHTQEAEEALHRALPELRLLHTMVGHEDGFTDLAYSPEGSRLVSTNFDDTVRVWDSSTGQELLQLSEPEEEFIRGRYREVAYSSDGSYFVTAGDDGRAQVWDAASGELLTTFVGHRDIPRLDDPDSPNWIIGLAVSPDSKTIATSDKAGLVKLWDPATGAEIKTLDLSETAPNHWKLLFSPDGLRLIVFGDDPDESDYTIRIIEIDTGSELLSIEGQIEDFDLSPDGSRLIFSESYENEVRLWDLEALEEITRFATGEAGIVRFSPDGRLFATQDSDLDTIHFWEADTGREVMSMPSSHGHVIDIRFSPDGTRLATTGWDHLLKVWDIRPDYELMTVQPFSEDDSPLVTQIRFSQDGTILAAGSVAGGVSLWDPVTGKSMLTLAGHDDWVGGLEFSPDGDRLASGSDDSLVKVWDTTNGDLLLTMTDHKDWVNNIAYSPDGTTIASVGNDAQSFVWDATTGEVLHQFSLPEEAWGIAYSPDSTLLATGSLGTVGNVTVWDIATGEAVRVIDNVNGADDVHFSNDGSLLMTAGTDGIVRILEVETGQLVREIEADQSVIWGSSLSPDGTIFATAAGGSDVRLWDLESGERLLTLDGSEGGIDLVEFTPDGTQIVTSGGQNGYMRFLVLSVDELVEIAESRLTRSLSEEECQEYLHMDTCPAE